MLIAASTFVASSIRYHLFVVHNHCPSYAPVPDVLAEISPSSLAYVRRRVLRFTIFNFSAFWLRLASFQCVACFLLFLG